MRKPAAYRSDLSTLTLDCERAAQVNTLGELAAEIATCSTGLLTICVRCCCLLPAGSQRVCDSGDNAAAVREECGLI